MHQLNQHNVPHLSSLTLEELKDLVHLACYCRVIENDQGLAGFLLAMLPEAEYNSENFLWFKQRYQKFLYVDRVAVQASAQGQGCGLALYQDLEKYCEGVEVNSIGLEVNTKPLNQGSLDFHQKIGFKQVATQETGGGAKTVSLMMKNLKI